MTFTSELFIFHIINVKDHHKLFVSKFIFSFTSMFKMDEKLASFTCVICFYQGLIVFTLLGYLFLMARLIQVMKHQCFIAFFNYHHMTVPGFFFSFLFFSFISCHDMENVEMFLQCHFFCNETGGLFFVLR